MLVLIQDKVQQLGAHILWGRQGILLQVREREARPIVDQLVSIGKLLPVLVLPLLYQDILGLHIRMDNVVLLQ